MAQAAGRLWVPICRCRSTADSPPIKEHIPQLHNHVLLSGFWLKPDAFITSAHFLNVQQDVGRHQKEDTIQFLRTLREEPVHGEENMRGRVSTEYYVDTSASYRMDRSGVCLHYQSPFVDSRSSRYYAKRLQCLSPHDCNGIRRGHLSTGFNRAQTISFSRIG